MPEKFAKWNAAEYIDTMEDARLLLESCAEEDPGDGSLIRAGLGNVVRAQRKLASLARDTGMTRAGLHRALSETGNPSFATVVKVIYALGLRLEFVDSPKVQAQDPGHSNIA